jgi:hypothetical protein
MRPFGEALCFSKHPWVKVLAAHRNDRWRSNFLREFFLLVRGHVELGRVKRNGIPEKKGRWSSELSALIPFLRAEFSQVYICSFSQGVDYTFIILHDCHFLFFGRF